MNIKKPSYLNFKHEGYSWKKEINYKEAPEKYRIGKGEQGVLICQPYKDEIGAHWRFKNPELALKSSEKIYQIFLDYLAQGDFVGADLARKYLQMGFTRARRYANYRGGKKYTSDYSLLEKGTGDEQKAISAEIFFKKWKEAEGNIHYSQMKKEWKNKYG